MTDGIVERIGEGEVRDNGGTHHGVVDHEAALRIVFDRLEEPADLVAVGHRIVHGGKAFYEPTVITDAVVEKLEEVSPLAPLHNPPRPAGHTGRAAPASRSAPGCRVRHRVLP